MDLTAAMSSIGPLDVDLDAAAVAERNAAAVVIHAALLELSRNVKVAGRGFPGDDVRDSVVQTVLGRLVNGRRDARPTEDSGCRGYLVNAMRFGLIDWIRRNAPREPVVPKPVAAPPRAAPTPDVDAVGKLLTLRIYDEVKRLQGAEVLKGVREAVQDMTALRAGLVAMADLAALRGVSADTLYHRHQRARERLLEAAERVAGFRKIDADELELIRQWVDWVRRRRA